MELLTTLALAHLLADFPLQSNLIAARKTKSIFMLLTHVLIHVLVSWALLGFKWGCWPIILAVGVGHFAVDWLKPRVIHTNLVRAFLIDQCAHMFMLFFVAGIAVSTSQTPFVAVLPSNVLYPSLLLGFIFAIMVFVWLWTTTLHHDMVNGSRHLRWSRERLLEIEQRIGFGLICFMLICLLLN